MSHLEHLVDTVPAFWLDPAFEADVVRIADAAAREVMAVYATRFAVSTKHDASPVTEADQRAEAVIVAGLRALTPELAIVAEEAMARGDGPRAVGECFWLVDPLDGTREFVARNGEFTVNLALVVRGEPVFGVVHTPALDRLYVGASALDRSVTRTWMRSAGVSRAIGCRHAPAQGLHVLASRSHGDGAATDALLARQRVARVTALGSSLKLGVIAAGEADLYVRLGRTMAWDIAAGHAVLRAAGGEVRRVDDHAPVRYGDLGFENPAFVAHGLDRPR